MTFERFFSPFFLFWGSDLMFFIAEMLFPTLVLFSLVFLILGAFFNV